MSMQSLDSLSYRTLHHCVNVDMWYPDQAATGHILRSVERVTLRHRRHRVYVRFPAHSEATPRLWLDIHGEVTAPDEWEIRTENE